MAVKKQTKRFDVSVDISAMLYRFNSLERCIGYLWGICQSGASDSKIAHEVKDQVERMTGYKLDAH